MTGPIVTCVSGKSRFTECARRCALEWRRISMPSGESPKTGAIVASASTLRERSTTRSPTFAARVSPMRRSPSARSASAAVVPCGTDTSAPPARATRIRSSVMRWDAGAGLIGTGGIEPPASSVSRKRSPTELRAYAHAQEGDFGTNPPPACQGASAVPSLLRTAARACGGPSGRLECAPRVAGAALRGVLLRRLPVPALPALPLRGGLLRAAGVGGDPRPRLLSADESAGRAVSRAARTRRAGARAGGHGGGGPALLPARLAPRAGGDGRLPPSPGGRPAGGARAAGGAGPRLAARRAVDSHRPALRSVLDRPLRSPPARHQLGLRPDRRPGDRAGAQRPPLGP